MSVRVHFPCFYIQKRRIIRPSAKLTDSQRVLFRAIDLPHDFILISSSSEPFLLYYPTPLYPGAITKLLSASSPPPLPPARYRLFLLLYLLPRSITIVPLLPALPLHFPHPIFPPPSFVMVFALHRSCRIAIGYEVIDKNLSSNSTDSQAHQWN